MVNIGLLWMASKKRMGYNDMTVSQWVAGQLNNISQIQDNDLLRLVLSQVIAAMNEESSLLRHAVRSAWASFMHEMEEGKLTWRDTTQCALNRLNNAQVAMNNSQVSSHGKACACMYYNEGICTCKYHHGICKHVCVPTVSSKDDLTITQWAGVSSRITIKTKDCQNRTL